MILQSFKLKNIDRRTEKHLQKERINDRVNNCIINSVLIFVDEHFNEVYLDALTEALPIKKENIQKIIFCSGKNNEGIENVISAKDFGLFGKFKRNISQLNFDKGVDLIINYTHNNSYVDNLITQLNASFSVGVRNKNGKIYDLIIEVEKNELELFNVELEKYLKILNKI
ncbi:DUF6913 domain-containing protein [Urechidicola vernalis]|uniref:Uncharacterized protein n=1 Tax=Urechidicola vernalis TaxID=3075600 RepID=A0ABU2Y8H4_9FLAO|nr:hypothetical protein [Urechidicola sp. P050]MDT0553964.1 hypothetical protein [Urechidicola sp. P050]